MITIIMPKLGLTMEEGTVISWLKKEGEPVQAGEALLSVETDKVTVDVEAPAGGVLLKIVVPEGTAVPLETVIAYIGEPGEAIPAKTLPGLGQAGPGHLEPGIVSPPAAGPSQPASSNATGVETPGAPSLSAQSPLPLKISPIARKLAEENGIDPASVVGTGPQGRIVEADIRLLLSRREDTPPAPRLRDEPPAPQAGQAQEAPFTLQRLSAIRRTTARRMSESAASIPHFYLNVELDAAPLVALRQQLNAGPQPSPGAPLTFTDLLLRALALSLPRHPSLNAAYHSPSEVKVYREVNLGVAIATPQGLVVGVIPHAGGMPLAEIARRRQALAAKAQERRLAPEDISGGTFTLTNLGMLGVDDFAPIVNPGQSAILAAGAIADRPWAEAGQLVLRPTLRLTLAVDHRVADGVDGARFLQDLRAALEEPDGII